VLAGWGLNVQVPLRCCLLHEGTCSYECAEQRAALQEQEHLEELKEREARLSHEAQQLHAQEAEVARLEGVVACLHAQLGERQGLLEAATAGSAELQAAAAARVRRRVSRRVTVFLVTPHLFQDATSCAW
jgi:hypothetical protein